MKAHNFTHYWCFAMIDRLIQHGCDHFFVAPGSRSTPLISAIARHERAHVAQSIDERSLGFMALGYAKKTRVPSVIVVTSGTAVANLLPAVVEASASSVPLIIISADRPYELRDTGANQTIMQPYIFSHYVRGDFDLAPPSAKVSIKKSEAIFDQAVHYACGTHPGPVHINTQFREPLNNVMEEYCVEARLPPPIKPAKISADISHLAASLNHKRGLIVVGELLPSRAQQKIIDLAERLQWPIFADVTSNVRFCDHPLIMHHFDVALLNRQFVELLQPEIVLHIGDRVVSKRYWAFIEKSSATSSFRLSEYEHTIDQTGHMQQIFVGNVEHALESLINHIELQESSGHELLELYRALVRELPTLLKESADNEAFFAAELIRSIPEKCSLFISSSMPIRDLDQWSPSSPFLIDVFAHRGASGIDGIISSAVGIALGSNNPTILLIGDVAFLHDTNGLMAIKQTKEPLLIIVINNSGGGIFHFLPIAQEHDVLTPYLDTPHSVNLHDLCKAHDIDYAIADEHNFSSLVKKFFVHRSSQVIEVKIARDKNVSLHKKMYRSIEENYGLYL